KEQIKSLVESGNILKAQKMILKEVESQVGGAAEAAADPVQKLEVAWGNLQEKIGTAIMPLLSKFADWISSTVVPAIGSMVESFQTGEVKSSGFVGALQGLAVLLGEVWRAVGPVIQWAWKNLIRPVLSGIGWFLSKIPEGLRFLNLAWAEIWAAIGGVLADVGTVILRGLQALFDGITFIVEKLIEAGNF